MGAVRRGPRRRAGPPVVAFFVDDDGEPGHMGVPKQLANGRTEASEVDSGPHVDVATCPAITLLMARGGGFMGELDSEKTSLPRQTNESVSVPPTRARECCLFARIVATSVCTLFAHIAVNPTLWFHDQGKGKGRQVAEMTSGIIIDNYQDV
jgi:hypothetical protein